MNKARKTAAKTPPPLRKPSHGHGALLSGGMPGNKGGTGRPPDEFKQLCQQLASGETTLKMVGRILRNPGHPQFIPALKWATEHGYGKPKESVEHSGTVEHKHQIWKFGDKVVSF